MIIIGLIWFAFIGKGAIGKGQRPQPTQRGHWAQRSQAELDEGTLSELGCSPHPLSGWTGSSPLFSLHSLLPSSFTEKCQGLC